ncbi:MAG: hypothetical protein ACYTX0_60520, partial [Nostoc sp.]
KPAKAAKHQTSSQPYCFLSDFQEYYSLKPLLSKAFIGTPKQSKKNFGKIVDKIKEVRYIE